MSLFKRRRFPAETILLCVRRYCKYRISYRDLAEIIQERGSALAHSPSSDGCELAERIWPCQGTRLGFCGSTRSTCGR